jgi:hypothetical protein
MMEKSDFSDKIKEGYPFLRKVSNDRTESQFVLKHKIALPN